ncbi:hypothetical protein, conserved [Trypanosoma brucei gambiense DAL972]|uniref:Uncharacterized protein n=1 Tax=Trypanosoma brucei gambiense (strain MHOM/CI/86/DAL972) TaxID=679716 RepID=D0A4C9_TRYB9|nr:hypothetical protein, conserved [Trypanosoma brucei gambiense DAL972]CBH16123.1 hypothetical protein, conserved [Trypanosoma brucei gambiense DAL972]|eukprot:XP_011778387.1 hypothetical protein, conserved [Trypanosoma brucei gambiense DAL972]
MHVCILLLALPFFMCVGFLFATICSAFLRGPSCGRRLPILVRTLLFSTSVSPWFKVFSTLSETLFTCIPGPKLIQIINRAMSSRNCSLSQGRLLSRQKRPLVVAQFLNKVPIEDRHAATNALLCLGLRAYKMVHATTPPDMQTLRSAVSAEISAVASGSEGLNDQKIDEGTASGRQRGAVDDVDAFLFARRERGQAPSSSPPVDRRLEGNTEEEEFYTRIESVRNVGEPSYHDRMPQLMEDVDVYSSSKSGADTRALNRLAGDGGESDRAAGKSGCFTDVLDFVTNCAVGSLSLCTPTRCREAANVSSSPPANCYNAPGSEQPNMGHASPLRASGSQDLPLGGMKKFNMNTVVPLLDDNGVVYPVEFIHHLMARIKSTRGVRENPILVAAYMPQSLAVYTLQGSFGDLYRSLLVSYHVSMW